MRFKIGVTATRDGLDVPQKRMAAQQFLDVQGVERIELHHGDCEGGDSDLHDLARALGGFWIIGHPPVEARFRAWKLCDDMMPERTYLTRNHNIVNAVEYMLCFPGTFTEQYRGSGTWATIRYAEKVGRRGLVIFPDATWKRLGEL